MTSRRSRSLTLARAPARARRKEPGQIDAEAAEVEGEEGQAPRAARDPGQPTRAEAEEHELTHIPYRPWCEACTRGKAKRKPSLRLSEAYRHSSCPRVRMDYAFLRKLRMRKARARSRAEAQVQGLGERQRQLFFF